MTSKMPDPLSGLTGHQAELFKLWISFFPVAPLFGVEWRFAAFFPGMGMATLPLTPPHATREMSSETAPAETVSATMAESAATAHVAQVIPIAPEPAPAPTPVPADTATAEPAAPETGSGSGAGPEASEIAPPANLFEAAPAEADDLKMIKGIGPGLESKLNALGIYRFDQIASFTDKDLLWIDDNLTTFKGRCFRDDWVGQAKSLLH